MKLYITDSSSITNKMLDLFSSTKIKENIYYDNKGTYILYIDSRYYIEIDGKNGRWLYQFRDGNKDIKATINYISKNDISNLQEILKENIISEVINICESTSVGQFNYEILMRMIKRDTKEDRRIWLSENYIDDKVITRTMSNEKYQIIAESLLCEYLIDAYWEYKGKEIHGNDSIIINPKDLLVLILLKERADKIDEKEELIKDKKEYYRIQLESEGLTFKWYRDKEDRLEKFDEIDKVIEDIQGKPILITSIEKSASESLHPLLYNTTDIQNDIKRKGIIDTSEIKDILQKLYIEGYITNPETAARHLPPLYVNKSIKILSALKEVPRYKKYIEYIKSKNSLFLTDRVINEQHIDRSHAIVPTTKTPISGDITHIEYEIYDMIVKRFLAIFMGAKLTHNIKILASIDENNKAKFEDSQVIEYGWELLLRTYDDSDYVNERIVDIKEYKDVDLQSIDMRSGKRYPIKNVTVKSGKQKARLPYTEVELLEMLENCGKRVRNEKKKVLRRHLGVGQVGERGSIILRIIEKGLIEKNEDGRIVLTDKGEEILSKVPATLATKSYIELLIKKMKSIMIHGETLRGVVSEHIACVLRSIHEKKMQSTKVDPNTVVDYRYIIESKLCPICISRLIDTPDSIKCSNCEDLSIEKVKCGYILTMEDIILLIDHGITSLITGFVFKKGAITDGKARLKLDERGKVIFDFNKN